MKIGLAQLNSVDDLNENFKSIVRLIEIAKVDKPELIIFPENSLYFRLDTHSKVKAIKMSDPILLDLQRISDQTKIALHLTTAVEDADNKIFNASILIQAGKQPIIIYRKVHLFDISLKDQKPIRESDSFLNGNEPTIFELNGFKFGSSICYDIRFSELYSFYAKEQVDVILVPAAFLVKTGQAHWEVLLRARAIESQCYILAPAQAGKHVSSQTGAQRETYGNTMAIDPWGQILVQKSSEVGLVFIDIKKSEIEAVRRQIPMSDHRRL
ncbi:MAG: carbon-nitrogen hydrolase family protein [Bdellovibrionaceae bacterium]|nr:carbon-nitrogen hydrolase family protein [Bdellovibrio sp.]